MTSISTGTTGSTGTTNASNAGTGDLTGALTGQESSLSSWVGPYVTDMLGKGQALSNTGYQGYGGALTAGPSQLQNQAFSGLAGLTVPTSQMGGFDANRAQQLMNPYLMASLQPQINEANRQAEFVRAQNAGRLAQSGAFGGSRQAIMESEAQRNLNQNIADITGKGYATAFDKAMEQQNNINSYGLAALQKQADLGATQRGIESEDIANRRKEFEAARDDPFKKVQYQQSLLQGLPVATQNYNYQQPSALTELMNAAGGAQKLWDMFFGAGATGGTTQKP
jgi:hypothetical protein